MWCATAGLSFCSPGKADGKIDRLYRYFNTCGNTPIFVFALSTYYIWAMIVTIWLFFSNIAPYCRLRLNIVDIRKCYRPTTCSDY